MLKEIPGDLSYGIYASDDASRPAVYINIGGSELSVSGTASISLNTWTHLAGTYDGAMLRLFVNGSQVGTRATTGSIGVSTNPLRIGGNAIWGEYFSGRIDEVRIYNRALTQAEIQTDMNTSISAPDTTPPTVPTNLTATPASSTQINLSWTASTDNIAVTGYQIERCQGAGCTTFALLTTVTGTTYNNTGLTASTPYSYRVRATDGPNFSGYSGTASATTQASSDTTPPTVPTNLTATPAGSTQINLSWTASTDNTAVTGYQIERCQGAGCTTFALLTTVTGTTYNNTGLTASTPYSYRVRATDGPNFSGYSGTASATTQASSTVVGLVAAYGFIEGSGSTTADASGSSNTGTISGATWTTSGRYGNALSFNGTSSRVNINDANSLDLRTGMTLEAWVYPTSLTGWRTVMLKEISGDLSYGIYASDDASRPAVYINIGGSELSVQGTASISLNTWTHLAGTYDGAMLRLFVNGSQVGTRATTGSIGVSTNPLRIGGNAIWGEYFSGRIDEVRIYNRALTPTEIQTDMNTSISAS